MVARVQAVYSGLLTYDTLVGRILGRDPNFQYPRQAAGQRGGADGL